MALVDRYCTKCIYRGSWPSGDLKYCRYLEVTGEKRPCGAGTGCTVRATKAFKIKKKKG